MRDPSPKQCGDCSLCCKLLAIPELQKPRDQWCVHIVKKRGCGIYEARPQSCRAFQCVWLAEPLLPPEWKPSQAKFVMVQRGNELAVHVDANAPGAWRAEPYLSGLRAMALAGQDQGGLVVIMERGNGTVLLHDREVDVGVLAEDERLVSGYAATPSGPRFEVKVMKTQEAARLAETALDWRQKVR